MRIVAFGDSWTAGHGVETDSIYKEETNPPEFIQKLREQNSWPRWLSEKMGIPYINMGYCGFGNEYILNQVEKSKQFFNNDDIIIVVFTHPKGTLSYILEVEEKLKNTSVWEYGSSTVWNDEKNYFEGDYHPNLNGYKIISNFMYNEIKKLI